MQRQVVVSGHLYTANNIRPDGANFEVTTIKGSFIKSFLLQIIGDACYPEPDYTGVSFLNERDIIAIETILPGFPTAELRFDL